MRYLLSLLLLCSTAMAQSVSLSDLMDTTKPIYNSSINCDCGMLYGDSWQVFSKIKDSMLVISDDGWDSFDSRSLVDTSFWNNIISRIDVWKPTYDTVKKWLLISYVRVGTKTNFKVYGRIKIGKSTRPRSVDYYRYDVFMIEGYIVYNTYEKMHIAPNPTAYLDEHKKLLSDAFIVWDSKPNGF